MVTSQVTRQRNTLILHLTLGMTSPQLQNRCHLIASHRKRFRYNGLGLWGWETGAAAGWFRELGGGESREAGSGLAHSLAARGLTWKRSDADEESKWHI